MRRRSSRTISSTASRGRSSDRARVQVCRPVACSPLADLRWLCRWWGSSAAALSWFAQVVSQVGVFSGCAAPIRAGCVEDMARSPGGGWGSRRSSLRSSLLPNPQRPITRRRTERKACPVLLRVGGGWGIRTPESFHSTRFPSVRTRPLCESSRRRTMVPAGGAMRPIEAMRGAHKLEPRHRAHYSQGGPSRGGTSLNSPRAGMQQGQVSSSRCVRDLHIRAPSLSVPATRLAGGASPCTAATAPRPSRT